MAPVYESDAARAYSGNTKKYAQERPASGRNAAYGSSQDHRRSSAGRSKQGANERSLVFGGLSRWVPIQSLEGVARLKSALSVETIDFNALYALETPALCEVLKREGYACDERNDTATSLLQSYLEDRGAQGATCLRIDGVLEPLGNGDAVLVYLKDNYEMRALSAFVPACLIEHYQLKRGHFLSVRAIPPVEGASCPVVVDILEAMGEPPAKVSLQFPFSDQETLYPQYPVVLDVGAPQHDARLRAIDLLAPLGLGGRGIIAGPARSGKTTLLHSIAKAMVLGHPHLHLIVLQLDECPECIAALRETVNAEIVSSSFSQSAENHVHAAEIVIHRARRLVEHGKDVVVLLDSMTRLVRAYNAVFAGNGRTRILPGGLDVSALTRPKRFFSAGRALRDGGSLTLLATFLTQTGSAMDESIYDAFKDASNQVLHLDAKLAKQHQFPAIDMELSGSYREELLYHPEVFEKILTLRSSLLELPKEERMPFLLDYLTKTHSDVGVLSHLDR
jgi:transcription termination factor Rho